MVDPILVGAGITTGIIAGITVGGFGYSVYDPTKAASIKLRTEEGEFEPIIESPRKKHGLIILGNGEDEVKKSIENSSDLVYRALRKSGYEQERVYVLEGKKSPKRLSCHSLPSSKKHLKEVLDHLYKEVRADDVFFMYVLSHGEKTGLLLPFGQSTFLLNSGIVKEEELEELLSDLHPNHSVTYFNNCYGGGFARRLGKGRNVAISVSRADKTVKGHIGEEAIRRYGHHASNFTLYFFSGLKGELPNGEPIRLEDKSLDNLFDYASEHADYADNKKGSGRFGKNTPHLVYGKINPREVRL